MGPLIIAVIGFISLFFLAVACNAQSKGWDIITPADDTLRSCSIGTIFGNSVNIVCGEFVANVPVDSIVMLKRHRESHFWSQAGYGALYGTGIGAIIGLMSHQESTGPFAVDFGPGVSALGFGILGGVAGFTIGGIFGAASGGDDGYDLSDKTTEQKISILRMIRRSE